MVPSLDHAWYTDDFWCKSERTLDTLFHEVSHSRQSIWTKASTFDFATDVIAVLLSARPVPTMEVDTIQRSIVDVLRPKLDGRASVRVVTDRDLVTGRSVKLALTAA